MHLVFAVFSGTLLNNGDAPGSRIARRRLDAALHGIVCATLPRPGHPLPRRTAVTMEVSNPCR